MVGLCIDDHNYELQKATYSLLTMEKVAGHPECGAADGKLEGTKPASAEVAECSYSCERAHSTTARSWQYIRTLSITRTNCAYSLAASFR